MSLTRRYTPIPAQVGMDGVTYTPIPQPPVYMDGVTYTPIPAEDAVLTDVTYSQDGMPPVLHTRPTHLFLPKIRLTVSLTTPIPAPGGMDGVTYTPIPAEDAVLTDVTYSPMGAPVSLIRPTRLFLPKIRYSPRFTHPTHLFLPKIRLDGVTYSSDTAPGLHTLHTYSCSKMGLTVSLTRRYSPRFTHPTHLFLLEDGIDGVTYSSDTAPGLHTLHTYTCSRWDGRFHLLAYPSIAAVFTDTCSRWD